MEAGTESLPEGASACSHREACRIHAAEGASPEDHESIAASTRLEEACGASTHSRLDALSAD